MAARLVSEAERFRTAMSKLRRDFAVNTLGEGKTTSQASVLGLSLVEMEFDTLSFGILALGLLIAHAVDEVLSTALRLC